MLAITYIYQVFLLGFLLYCMFRYVSCLEGYWKESTIPRSYIPDSELVSMEASTLYTCMIQCLMTDRCCSVSYIAVTSVCGCRLDIAEVQSENSSSTWYIVRDNCPCGWYRFKASCFLFTRTDMAWNDSQAFCRLLDARLAEADTEEKDTFIRGIAVTLSGSFWLGGSDSAEEGKWLWTTSNLSMTQYNNWTPSNPNNYGGEGKYANCMCIGTWTMFNWDDCNCWQTLDAVCEKPDL